MARLRPLIFVHPPYDFLEDDQIQDELIAGGVRDLMFGWWTLLDDRPETDPPPITGPETEGRFVRRYYSAQRRGRPVAPFHPTTHLYEGSGGVPRDMPAGLESKAERFERMVANLSAKGISVYTFGVPESPERWLAPEGNEEKSCINSTRAEAYNRARLRDFDAHYPTLSGCVTDGPGFGYEITPGFRGGGQLFAPLCTCASCQGLADRLGVDLDAMQSAIDRLQSLAHGLTPAQVDLFLENQQGVFDAVDLFLEDPAVVDLLRFRTASIDSSVGRTYRAIKEVNPRWQYGICPRLPCFAPMQGCNFRHLSQVTDFIQSKHYLWMGGIDGFKGTLARYVQTLREWNPALDTTDIEALICQLLGVRLPSDYQVADFDRPAPKAFFDEVVYRESRKMLQRIGDPEKVSPFLGLEHGGIWLNAEELGYLLQAMVDAGLTRFTYYILNTIDDDVWNVMRQFTAG